MALQVRRLTNPDRTEITDSRRRWLARFTDGATTVTSSGPRRRFSEPTAADAVTHTVWVRTLPRPFTGIVDEAWLTAALQANALRVPDVLAIRDAGTSEVLPRCSTVRCRSPAMPSTGRW